MPASSNGEVVDSVDEYPVVPELYTSSARSTKAALQIHRLTGLWPAEFMPDNNPPRWGVNGLETLLQIFKLQHRSDDLSLDHIRDLFRDNLKTAKFKYLTPIVIGKVRKLIKDPQRNLSDQESSNTTTNAATATSSPMTSTRTPKSDMNTRGSRTGTAARHAITGRAPMANLKRTGLKNVGNERKRAHITSDTLSDQEIDAEGETTAEMSTDGMGAGADHGDSIVVAQSDSEDENNEGEAADYVDFADEQEEAEEERREEEGNGGHEGEDEESADERPSSRSAGKRPASARKTPCMASESIEQEYDDFRDEQALTDPSCRNIASVVSASSPKAFTEREAERATARFNDLMDYENNRLGKVVSIALQKIGQANSQTVHLRKVHRERQDAATRLGKHRQDCEAIAIQLRKTVGDLQDFKGRIEASLEGAGEIATEFIQHALTECVARLEAAVSGAATAERDLNEAVQVYNASMAGVNQAKQDLNRQTKMIKNLEKQHGNLLAEKRNLLVYSHFVRLGRHEVEVVEKGHAGVWDDYLKSLAERGELGNGSRAGS